jgi:ABC-type lipoprotein release transport system permease subunit
MWKPKIERIRPTEQISLFDRVALAVCGAVLGYISGLGLGWTLMFVCGATGLFAINPTTGKFFFYYLPLAITLLSATGFAFRANMITTFLATIWRAVIGLSGFDSD